MKLTPGKIINQIGPDLWEDEHRDVVTTKKMLRAGILINTNRPHVVKIFEELKAAERPVDPEWMCKLGRDEDGKIMALRAPAVHAYFLMGKEAQRLSSSLNNEEILPKVTNKKLKKKLEKKNPERLPINMSVKIKDFKMDVTREAKNKEVEIFFDTLTAHLLYRDSLLDPTEIHSIFFIN